MNESSVHADNVSEQVAIINEPDRVIFEGEWGGEVIYDVMYSGTDHRDEFDTLFEIVAGHHMADPNESFYQGIEFIALIRRKADGRLFGYPYWKPVAKHADCDDVEPNGDDHGFESEFANDYTEYVRGPFYVWLPVEPFTITGYQITPPIRGGDDS